MKIGFIGLGIMGGRMAANLLKNNIDLIVHNRTKSKADTLIQNGAKWAETPADLADSDIIITMLPTPEAIQQVAPQFLETITEKSLWIDCSTVHPSFSRSMADLALQHNVHFLDAPVAGTKPQAQNAELVFLVGGDSTDIETACPYLEMMGSRVAHIGDHGMGSSLKVVVNSLLATSMAAFAEALVLGQSLGIPQAALLNTLVGGPVVPPYMGMKKERLADASYDNPDFALRWMQKDLEMASIAGYEQAVSLPIGNLTKEIYQLAIKNGFGDADFSAIYQYWADSNSL